MSGVLCLLLDRFDFNFEEWLSVATFLKIATLGFVFDDCHLLFPADIDDFRFNLSPRDIRRADGGAIATINKKHFVESDLAPLFVVTFDLFDHNGFPRGDSILLSACGNYGYFHRIQLYIYL